MTCPMRRSHRRVGLLIAAALLLASCGGEEEEAQTSGESLKTAKIGLIVPLSGDLSAIGTGIRNSVDLAITQANERKTVKGWKLELAAEDDAAKAEVGAQAATKLASDQAVVGVIGTYNSSVAQQVIPILARSSIVQISPANTNDTLTRGENFANQPKRPYPNYFRLATLDSLQGKFAADYATGTVKAKTAAIIHDKKTYGQGLADSFRSAFEANGGRSLTVETISPGDKDFSGVLAKIRPMQPDIIFYGGEYPEASLITSQAKQAGLKVPLMGGDGIVADTYTEVAGDAAEGDLGTSVGAPPEQLPSAKAFIDAYKAAGYRDSYSAYGAAAYDSANALIRALTKVLPNKERIDESVRKAILDEVQRTDFDGASGKVAFDEYGDTLTRLLTVHKVVGGAFKPEKTAQL